MKQTKIIAVHLLNDFSGSPFVLRQCLEVFINAGYTTELFTATPSEGFLSNINGIRYHNIFYKWNRNKFITLMLYLYSQYILFIRLLFHLKKNDLVYINSLLPFGAALAAWIRGCKVIYHIHEVSLKPALLKKFLLMTASLAAHHCIFVSHDVRRRTKFRGHATVVYNALPEDFVAKALTCKKQNMQKPFTILMACSLKKYKGVYEFLQCAEQLPNFRFQLVLNASEKDIEIFFTKRNIPANVNILPAQKNMHPYYESSDVVMNLSRPDEWVETFGMTILEAMYYGKPVIIPPVGGIAELITDGCEGFCIHSSDIHFICKKLKMLSSSLSLYSGMSENALRKAGQFNGEHFSAGILRVLESVLPIDHDKEAAIQLMKNPKTDSGISVYMVENNLRGSF